MILAALMLLASFGMRLNAQVTIGDEIYPQDFSVLELISNNEKGLRLPQMTTGQRDAITTTAFKNNAKANGLMIYNTTIDCVETWNGVDKKWVSLCGNGTLIITPDPGNTCDTIPADGTCTPSYEVEDPTCTTDGEYTFTWITGSEYASLNILDAGAGLFTVQFLPNDRASSRNAILLVTSPCGTSGTFVFTQEGDDSLCTPGATAPTIAGENTTSLCSGGAVYLYLTNGSGGPRLTGANGNYIWTLNGQVVASDTVNYMATQAGKYIVYAGAVGCTTPKPDTLVIAPPTGTGAPDPVAIIVGVNIGNVCDPAGTTRLYVKTPASGTLAWYQNGAKNTTATTGVDGTYSYVEAGIGQWFAVVEAGSCSSTPSNTVNVKLSDDAGTALAPPAFTVNGQSGSPIQVCAGGTLLLAVTSPDGAYTYSWYVNNTLKGTGSTYELSMAGITGDFILQCRVSNDGSNCSQAGISEIQVTATSAPSVPRVDNQASGHYLCGGSATLTVTGTAPLYRWYRNGTFLQTTTIPELNITELGAYTAQAVSALANGCVSGLSEAFHITGNSGYGSVVIREDAVTISGQTGVAAEESTSKTLIATINPAGGETYTWTITGNATPATATGSSVTINFGAAAGGTNVDVSVVATNACTPGVTAATNFTIAPYCPASVSIAGYMPASKTAMIVGSGSAPLSVTPDGNPANYDYQWYNSAGDISLPGETNRTYLATATGSYYCVVKAKCDNTVTVTSDPFTVQVFTLPSGIGTGSFIGKTCFDIAESDCEGSDLTGRTAQKTNFALRTSQDPTGSVSAPYTGVQVYTFKAITDNVSNVRYVIDDPDDVVDAATPVSDVLQSGALANGSSVKLTVTYKSDLNTTLVGTSRAQAKKVTINIIYNNGSGDVKVPLNITIQDCACCGAFVAANVWKAFMCHNLGADQTADPFKPVAAIHGAKYQWGKALPVLDQATDQSNSGVVSDWPAASTNTSWLAVNNPCPAGWRVPTDAEWAGVRANNTVTRTNDGGTTWTTATGLSWITSATNFSTGIKFGNGLMLPAEGNRKSNNGTLQNRGNYGFYWSSVQFAVTMAYDMNFGTGNMGVTTPVKSFGFSVRCISE